MPRFEMAPGEDKELLAILERYYPKLREEIANTDDREFRKFLKRRQAFMEGIMKRLRQSFAV